MYVVKLLCPFICFTVSAEETERFMAIISLNYNQVTFYICLSGLKLMTFPTASAVLWC